MDIASATSPESLQAFIAHASLVPSDSIEIVGLRAGGMSITPTLRDELLAKVRAGQYVELDADILAYEQKPGVFNRKFVRVREGAMQALGRSGKGKPFLRDHEQGDVHARGGTIISSTSENLGEGHYALRLTARLTAPWAVDLSLRGLLSTVSVGLSRGEGQLLCSVCNAPVFSQCYHLPGDRLAERVGDDGVKRKMRDRNGPIVVEWMFTDPVLDECSACSVPAVPSAHIEGIRAALAAHPDFRAESAHRLPGGFPGEETSMFAKLAAVLGVAALAAETDEDRAVRVVEELKRDKLAAEQERDAAILRAETAEGQLNAEVEERKTQATNARKANVDALLAGAYQGGKLINGRDENGKPTPSLREARLRRIGMEEGEEALAAELAEMPKLVPVGTRAVLPTDPVPPKASPNDSGIPDAVLAATAKQLGVTVEELKKTAREVAEGGQ